MISSDIKRLSKSEKLLLVQDLWDDISGGLHGISVTDDEVKYVNDRIREIENSGEKLIAWDDIKAKATAERA
jgi:putative addiction module component (TIGR02574 family)